MVHGKTRTIYHNKKNPYLAAILATYVSTYICGISLSHLEYKSDTPGIITSMARYHLYYQINGFLKDPSGIERYIAHQPQSIRRHKPTTDIWSDAFDQGSEEINTWLSEVKDQSKIRLPQKPKRLCDQKKLPKGHWSVT